MATKKKPVPNPFPDDRCISVPELGRPFKFAVIGDTHLGSKHQQLTSLHDFYGRAEAEKVQFVLHAGDLTEGNGHVYRGQTYEMFVHAFDDQVAYVAEHYPRLKGIKTYVLGGNHDDSWRKQGAGNIVRAICRERDDLTYIGWYGGYIRHGRTRLYLHHGAGGCTYARSYKVQRLIEGMSSENKPHFAFFGHWHQHLSVFLRNVHAYLAGCFQSQTDFLARLGLEPEVGGWIIEADIGGKYEPHRVRSEWIPYFRHMKRDY